MKFKFSEKGFSLMELTVALGLAGLVSLGGMQLLQKVNQNKKRMDIKSKSIETNATIQRYFQKIKKGIFQDNFKPTISFARVSGNYVKATWTDKARKIPLSTPEVIYNSSHSFQVLNKETNVNTIFVSRCVPNANFETNFTNIDTVLNLPYVPMVRIKSNSKDQVYCCLLANSSSCSSDIMNKESNYRVRTFKFFNGNLTQFPNFGDKKYLEGTGFILYFNSPTDPFSYMVKIFSQHERCLVSQKNCKSTFLTDIQTEQGAVSQSGIHDTGLLEVN